MKFKCLFLPSFLLLSFFTFADERLIPQNPSYRVIVDNDFAGDPDGLAALAHQLLTPKTKTVLVTVTGLNPEMLKLSKHGSDSALEGKDRVIELLKQIDTVDILIAAGRDLRNTATTATPSSAALAIVKEAMRDDELPLLFTSGGPLSNLAEALKLEPKIAQRMTLIWIGGGNYPTGGWEYNLSTDLDAVKYVFENTTIPVWQIPQATYRQMQYSVAEMNSDFRPISPLTHWLYDFYTRLPKFIELGGSLTMGDHPLVLLSALSTESSVYKDIPAKQILPDSTYGDELPNRTIRVFSKVDFRLTFADFIALLRLQVN